MFFRIITLSQEGLEARETVEKQCYLLTCEQAD